MPTPKFEVTILEKIQGGYDTWQRGIMGVGEICNQFCRSNPKILQKPLSSMEVGDEYEWGRKSYNTVHFCRVQ